MKLIREHINEKFTEKSDPIDDMGIGYLNDLEKRFSNNPLNKLSFSKMTLNQLLMFGVSHYNNSNSVDVEIELIQYAIKQGADQLWCNKEGSFINQIVKIIKVNREKYKPTIKYTFKPLWNLYIGTNISADVIGTSSIFNEKYKPITTQTIKGMDEIIKKTEKMKDLIYHFTTKIDNPPY